MSNYKTKLKEEFLEKFSVNFFAAEDWQYDYRDNPSELKFKSWQENQTNIAKTKQDMLLSFFLDRFDQYRAELEQKIEGLPAFTPCSDKTMGEVSEEAKKPMYGTNYLERETVISLIKE